jgi:hypothetical protein
MGLKAALSQGQGQGDGNGSAGLQAARNQTPRSRATSDDDEGVGMGDDNSGNDNRQYGNVEPPGWGFDGLGSTDDTTADDDAEMLLGNLEDADSNAAEQASDRGDDDDEYGAIRTPTSWMDRDDESINIGGPSDDYEDDQVDDHEMYSSGRHIEDASMTSVGDNDDPPPVDITLSDDSGMVGGGAAGEGVGSITSSDGSHAKMD